MTEMSWQVNEEVSLNMTGESDGMNKGVDSRDTYLNERFVIFNVEMVGGWERVTTDEERVLRGGWIEMMMMNVSHKTKTARKIVGCVSWSLKVDFDRLLGDRQSMGDRQSSHPVKTLLQYYGKSLEALPGVAYPGFRDNRSTLNTKTGFLKKKLGTKSNLDNCRKYAI